MKTNKEIIEAAESYANEFNDNLFAREVAFQAACIWIQEQDNWISVKDKLPKVGKKYKESVCVLGFEQHIESTVVCWYNSRDGWIVFHYKADYSPIQITHWQPLPKNPKI